MNSIIRVSSALVLTVWGALSGIQEGYWGFGFFLFGIALVLVIPILSELNGQFFPEKVEPKKNKFRPRAVY